MFLHGGEGGDDHAIGVINLSWLVEGRNRRNRGNRREGELTLNRAKQKAKTVKMNRPSSHPEKMDVGLFGLLSRKLHASTNERRNHHGDDDRDEEMMLKERMGEIVLGGKESQLDEERAGSSSY